MPKRRAQRRREQAGARGGGDEGEGANLHDVGARGGALADDDVQLVVLQRGVELLFEDGLEAVDLVEEQDLALAQVGEDGGEVALDLQGGAGGLLEADVELVGDDGGEGGFAQAGRAEEQDVVERLAAGSRGLEGDGELLFRLGLADELGETGGAELQLEGLVVVDAGGCDEAVGFGCAYGDGGFGMRLSGKFHAEAIVGRMGGLSKIRLGSLAARCRSGRAGRGR